VNVTRATANELLLEPCDAVADSGLDLALRLHGHVIGMRRL